MRRIGPVLAIAIALLLTTSNTAADPGINNLTNAKRESVGLPALPNWTPLHDLAITRARQITVDFDHPSNWQVLFDALPSCVTGLGENIALSTTSVYSDSWVVNAWWNSPEHHANMVGDWTFMASATTTALDTTYAVQLFSKGCEVTAQSATPTPAPAPSPKPSRSRDPQTQRGSPTSQPFVPDTAMPFEER